ncbi:MAG TPA: hypothetical protein VGP83_17120 [Pyrinomonadaceae bacterium]|jgi:hypothetical protein|nr:hypothetical protein [Pyrinomonadaceae bacterium]
MYKTLTRTLVGVSPLLMHNGRLANPLDPIAKMMKEVTSKRKKTDDDYELMSNIEWLGSIYTTDDLTVKIQGYKVTVACFGQLCIPGENVAALLAFAGAKSRRKQAFTAGILIEGDFPLQLASSLSIPEIFAKPGYRLIEGVRVGNSRVMRTRAIFRSWKLPLRIQYLPQLLNPREVDETLILGGQIGGLGDYRPKYGRFSVENVAGEAQAA